jgi:hypothetical protein
VWEGDGWKRTQRQLGAFFLLLLGGAEVFLDADIPIGMYSIVGGLLGLDILVEALANLRGNKEK